MKNHSHKISRYAFLFFVITIVLIMYPTDKIHAQPAISVKIDKWFSNSQEIFPLVKTEKIYKLALSGSIQLHKDNSLIRVILVGDDFHEYLVFEAYPLIVDNDSVNIINECEETCIIDGIAPHSLKIELIDASLHIDEMALTNYPPSLEMELAETRVLIKEERDAAKIKKLNENIKKKGLKWIAGETSVSKLFYEEKKKLFGGDKLPNLQGFEYYKGGVFGIKSEVDSSSVSDDGGSSLIESFDWRNRHGANDPNSPYYDGDATGSGWLTSVTKQGCADCWAHSAVGATEALTNLYFNNHLDFNNGLDLSIQDILSCSESGSCKGGSPGGALGYIESTGVVDELCFPYQGKDEPCGSKCTNPSENLMINGSNWIGPALGEENIKLNLIDYGPLNFGIDSWWHSMVLVGYDKDSVDGKTIWILKNSWGTGWGENGYGKIKVDLSDMYLLYSLKTPVMSLITPFEIACNDFDGDGYYNWGISDVKPSSCPESTLPDKDCDDNNPSLGPFDVNGHCVPIQANLLYTPVAPCKIVDTRNTSAGMIGANKERDFHVYGDGTTISAQGGNSAGCPAPLPAPLAAHINMVTVNPTGKGNMQVFSKGGKTGANLGVNFANIGTNFANAGTVQTATGSGPDITAAANHSSAHVTITVLGYYYPDGDLLYTSVKPCRIADTRKTSAGMIGANTQRNFHVHGTGVIISAQGGNPAGCPSPLGEPFAVHLNSVAVNPTGKGNMKIFPVGGALGANFGINFAAIGTNFANAGIVETDLGLGPEITVASNYSSAHTAIDVLGYYYQYGDFAYTPVTPCKIVDTRKTLAGMIGANKERDFHVYGDGTTISAQGGNSAGCPAPSGDPVATHINLIVANPTGKGNMQVFSKGGKTGANLGVNFANIGTNFANAGTVETSTGTGPDITVTSRFSSAHAVVDVLGYYYSAP